MSRHRVGLLLAFAIAFCAAQDASARDELRVEDSITFESLVPAHSSSSALHLWSPERAYVALVSQAGNLERNETVYRLWIYATAALRDASASRRKAPSPLVRMERFTRRNRPAISELTWAADEGSLFFLGEQDGVRQVTRLHLPSARTEVLTNAATDVVTFGVGGSRLVFSVEVAATDPFGDTGAKVVAGEGMTDLLGLRHERSLAAGPYRTFVQDLGGGDPVPLSEDQDLQASDHVRPFVSPDGRWTITPRRARTFSDSWRRYANANETFKFATAADGSIPYWIRQFMIVDLEKRSMRPVFDAPLGWVALFMALEQAIWLEGTPYVALVNTFLPLEGASPDEIRRREERSAIVLFDPSTGHFSRLMDISGVHRSPTSTEEVVDLRWRKREKILEVDLRERKSRMTSRRSYRLQGGSFAQVEADARPAEEAELALVQDFRTPPRLVARFTGRNTVTLEPRNEHLHRKRFGRADVMDWTDQANRKWQGGIYFPSDYDSARRYPVVIQTYGFSAASFRLDGAPLTGYAARALASKGMIVVQAGIDMSVGIKAEGQVHRRMIEGLIDHLDSKAIIDRDRVGLIGFSRTCYQVKYFLTHSSYPIRAAAIADGVDFGYLQYVIASAPHRGGSVSAAFELAYGGHPFGEARSSWLADAPTFNVDKVNAAVRVIANNRSSLLAEWEFYAALRRLSRPVELVLLRDGDHVLQRPREQWVAQQGNVDWFAFWLRDEVDPEPSKAEQYERWARLKLLPAIETRHASDQ